MKVFAFIVSVCLVGLAATPSVNTMIHAGEAGHSHISLTHLFDREDHHEADSMCCDHSDRDDHPGNIQPDSRPAHSGDAPCTHPDYHHDCDNDCHCALCGIVAYTYPDNPMNRPVNRVGETLPAMETGYHFEFPYSIWQPPRML